MSTKLILLLLISMSVVSILRWMGRKIMKFVLRTFEDIILALNRVDTQLNSALILREA